MGARGVLAGAISKIAGNRNLELRLQRSDCWVVGGHQGGSGTSHLAPYDHWVGFVCIGYPICHLVDPDKGKMTVIGA